MQVFLYTMQRQIFDSNGHPWYTGSVGSCRTEHRVKGLKSIPPQTQGKVRLFPGVRLFLLYLMLIDLNQQAGNMYKLPSLSFRGRSPWESPAPQYRLAASQLTL
jgi:hypothetical protein